VNGDIYVISLTAGRIHSVDDATQEKTESPNLIALCQKAFTVEGTLLILNISVSEEITVEETAAFSSGACLQP